MPSVEPARPIAQFLRLVSPDRADIGVVVVFSIIVGFIALAVPIAAQVLINYVAFAALVQPLVVLGFVLLMTLALGAGVRLMMTVLVEVLQRRLFVRVVTRLADRLPRVRSKALDGARGPELVNRFFDVLTVQKVGGTLLLDGVAALLQTVIGLTVLAFYHPFLLGFSGLLLLATAFVVFVLGRRGVSTAIDESTAKYRVASVLEEIAGNLTAVKQADAHALAFRRADEAAEGYVRARRAHFAVVLRQVTSALAIQVIAGASLLTLGGYLVIRNQLTLGQLVAAELIVAGSIASFLKIAAKLGDIYDMFAAVHKLSTLLELPTERQGGELHQPGPGAARLRLAGVGYSYGDGAAPVVDSLDLTVEPGERVAIVGRYGSGKSTLVDMLFAARSPTTGRIELDGIDYRELRVTSIRQHVGVVRGVEFFEGSVEENIRLGRTGCTLDHCREALERVGLLGEVRALPQGLATRLSGTGAPLSSGQRLRLMLARALAASPRLLIVDDVIDSLDEQTAAGVLTALFDRSWDCTVVVMSHRRWIAPFVDRVITLGAPGHAHPPGLNGHAVQLPGPRPRSPLEADTR